MIIEKKNQPALHKVLTTDLQRRLFKLYNNKTKGYGFNMTDEDYDVQQSLLVNSILHCETLADVNTLVCEYKYLFEMANLELSYVDKYSVCSLDGTMNYLFVLLAGSDKLSVQPNHEAYM